MNTENKISYVSPQSLAGVSKDAPVLVAFSGGADSSALLHLLAEDGKKNGFAVHAAHFHHGIRGEEADRDAEFCKSTAEKYGVPFYLGSADVPALAKKHGNSIETEAREQRYAFFAKIMRENNIPILVTAHHSEDQIESILLHVLRGSGVSGLCGIQPCRSFSQGAFIVRPILHAQKQDILSYCAENSIEFVTDSTNSDTSYKRNAIRHEILPKLRELQPNLCGAFARLSESANEADEFINAHALEFIEAECENGIPTDKFNQLFSAVRARVLSILFEEAAASTLERVHIESIIALAKRAEPHSSLSLPSRFCARIENCKIFFVPEGNNEEEYDFNVPFCEGQTLACAGVIINIEKNPTCDAQSTSLYLNVKCELIKSDAHFRSRAEGDVITTGKMNKKTKKLINEKKIPLSRRKKLPILVSDNKILWIPSVAVCDHIKTGKINEGEDFFRITVIFDD